MRGKAAHANADADSSAFAAFYDCAVRELYRYFHRATAGDRRVAEDLTQDTFVAAIRAFKSGQSDAITMPWLMGVARHKLIDHYRRRAREERKLSLVWSETSRTAGVDAIFDIDEAEAVSLLGTLSATHRLVLVLRYLDDLAVNDVAREIGKSVRATESILVRARQSLERTMQENRNG